MHNHDNHIKGITLIAISVFFIAAAAALAKWLDDYHPAELVFYRCVVTLCALSLYFSFTQKWALIKTRRIKTHINRALIGTIGILFGFAAVQALPLADATTLSFTGPLFVVILSYPLLKEKVGPYKIGAVIIGFIGVFIVADPSGEMALTGVAFAIAGAFTNALVQIYLRTLGKTEDPLASVFYFMLFGTCITAVFLPFVWVGPTWESLIFIFGLAIFSGTQQVVKAYGHKFAPVALTAPLDYTALIWAGLFGFLFWDTLPTWSVVFGALIIISSNAIILWQERNKKDKADA